MKTIKQVLMGIVAASFLAFTICATIICFYQLRLNTVEAQSNTHLSLEISTPQHKYAQLEPILIDLNLSNQNTVPVTWNSFLQIGSDDINLLVKSEKGDEVRWKGPGNVDVVMGTQVIQPGKNKKVESLIGGEYTEIRFPQPGRYQLRVEFRYTDYSYNQRQNITIVSNPINIDIDEPKGKDRLAYDYLKNIYQPVNRGSNLSEKTRVGQYFIDNFKDTVYWKYMTFDVANTYVMRKDYEKAEEAFFQISDVDFYYSKQVEKELQTVARKLERFKPKTKRQPDFSNAPIARPAPASTPVYNGAQPIPLVPIPLANPNPNSTPLR